MNREIKFRCWNPVHKMMLPSGDAYRCENGVFAEHETNNADGEVLMQYTGLHDKNGKEIYEGDIIEGREVTFANGRFDFEHDNEDGGWSLDYKGKPLFVVIGNVYENPDLLSKP